MNEHHEAWGNKESYSRDALHASTRDLWMMRSLDQVFRFTMYVQSLWCESVYNCFPLCQDILILNVLMSSIDKFN